MATVGFQLDARVKVIFDLDNSFLNHSHICVGFLFFFFDRYSVFPLSTMKPLPFEGATSAVQFFCGV